MKRLFFVLYHIKLCYKNEKCIGGKHSKERVTLFLCAFADGKFEKPLVIGKSLKPRFFKEININNLPVKWHANKKAWMTSKIMESWLKDFNSKMLKENRNVILFLDNATSHPHLELSNVKIVFFPPKYN